MIQHKHFATPFLFIMGDPEKRMAIFGTDFNVRVSSVLNKDTKQFGHRFIFDGDEETCWNSDEGSFQWILCSFKDRFILKNLNIQFQGGFSTKKLIVQFYQKDLNEKIEQDLEIVLYPEDNNLMQKFPIDKNIEAKFIKLFLPDCTDMFGRVIIYKIELIGLFA